MNCFNIAPLCISKLFQQNPGINPFNLTGARKQNIPSAKQTNKLGLKFKHQAAFGISYPIKVECPRPFSLSIVTWTRTRTMNGALAWPSHLSFHCRHWAMNIAESVRQDTIEYWQNKFKICMRILYHVNKAWDLLICFWGSITQFVQNMILRVKVIFHDTFGFISWNTDSTTFTSYLLTMSAIPNVIFKRCRLCDKSGRNSVSLL